jgi:alpha-tubulin suppressor-like RCC1 family protein
MQWLRMGRFYLLVPLTALALVHCTDDRNDHEPGGAGESSSGSAGDMASAGTAADGGRGADASGGNGGSSSGEAGAAGAKSAGGVSGEGGAVAEGGASGEGAVSSEGGGPGNGEAGAGPISPEILELRAGDGHNCVLLKGGQVKCWGSNWSGQLGYGNLEHIGDDELPSSIGTVSVTATPGVTATQLATGGHTCALLSDDSVKCWGYGSYGELGYGNSRSVGDDELPSEVGSVIVTSAAGVRVKQLACGAYHTCAVLSDGTVKCWGNGLYGSLGYGNSGYVGIDESPAAVGPVSVTTTPGVRAEQVVTGSGHSCALLSDHSVRCWGLGRSGQLGYGNIKNIGDNELPSSVNAVSVTSRPDVFVTSLVAGAYHTCALLSDGLIKCWGSNVENELGYAVPDAIGDSELPSSYEDLAVTDKPGERVVQLSAGWGHTCALISDGSVKCWGLGSYGQLGYGNTSRIGDGDNERLAALPAVSVTPLSGVTTRQLVAGLYHTCALLSNDSVKCWGHAFYGELGTGNDTVIGDDELPSSSGPAVLF